MIINENSLKSGMSYKVAGGGTTAIAVTGLVVGSVALVLPTLKKLMCNEHEHGHEHGHGHNHGDSHNNQGHPSGVNPNYYCQVTELKDQLFYLEGTKYTDTQVNKLEEKTECEMDEMAKRITHLETSLALSDQREKLKDDFSVILAGKNAIIQELKDSRFVVKQMSNPPGQQIVDCCKPLRHSFETNETNTAVA